LPIKLDLVGKEGVISIVFFLKTVVNGKKQKKTLNWAIVVSTKLTPSWGGRRILPYAFTEHGILMLSSVLKSERAVQVNIRIMRIFILMKEMIMGNEKLLLKIQKMEIEMAKHGKNIQIVFDYLEQFVQKKEKSRNRLGFRIGVKNQ